MTNCPEVGLEVHDHALKTTARVCGIWNTELPGLAILLSILSSGFLKRKPYYLL